MQIQILQIQIQQIQTQIQNYFQGGSVTLGCSVKEAGRPPASSFIWSVCQEDDDDDDLDDHDHHNDHNPDKLGDISKKLFY